MFMLENAPTTPDLEAEITSLPINPDDQFTNLVNGGRRAFIAEAVKGQLGDLDLVPAYSPGSE